MNVHPSKTEVRFRQQTFVHDFVRDSIREQLMESRPAPSFRRSPTPQPAAQLPYSEFSQALEDMPVTVADAEISFIPAERENEQAPVFALRPQNGPPPRLDFYDAPPLSSTTEPRDAPLRLRVPDTHGAFPIEASEAIYDAPASLAGIGDLRPLGQLHESFILAAGRDGLWIIDQHVAHERILFEQVLAARASGRVEVQPLLMPVVIQLTPGQQIEYARIESELAANGFETEPFGNRTIAIKAASGGGRSG